MTSYSDLLRDPRWQRKRLEVMQRDDFACRRCGDKTTTLNVHHTYYVKGRKPWEYETESLRTLCQPCHMDVSEELAEIAKYVGGFEADTLIHVLAFVRTLAIRASWPEEWRLCDDTTPRIPAEGWEEMLGVAAACGFTYEELEEALAGKDSLGWEEYRGVFTKRVAAREASAPAKTEQV